MGRHPTKAADSPFCQARLAAAEYNDRLFSKEGAADLLGVSASTLSDYELGYTKVIPPDMVIKMADLYNSPELENYYCTEVCPLGYGMAKIAVENLDRILIRALSAFRKLSSTEELLFSIAEDGVISEEAKSNMRKLLKNLEELENVTQNLRLWVKKNL